ncbi:putative Holliday junction resolvase YggF [Ichthyobacterium seriolicida]|uniref:Putative Holliday junction resolvase YggF n=1 Tax=Ichthyobacterium seriolicida TaxID=242600 RepID=A0A1J1E490_9FLAO|nr:putative Holliday junction resolvase YggF [Ichthyobacterium seriolicida]
MTHEKVCLFVVGNPVHLDYSNSIMSKSVDEFCLKLKSYFPDIPIEKIDERFTSKMAFDTIIECGVKKMKRRNKSLIDKISATLILQSYLNRKNSL